MFASINKSLQTLGSAYLEEDNDDDDANEAEGADALEGERDVEEEVAVEVVVQLDGAQLDEQVEDVEGEEEGGDVRLFLFAAVRLVEVLERRVREGALQEAGHHFGDEARRLRRRLLHRVHATHFRLHLRPRARL